METTTRSAAGGPGPGRRRRRKLPLVLAALVLLGLGGLWALDVAAARTAQRLNPLQPARGPVSARAAQVHARLPGVVDLHADSLLWKRSLLERGRSGHVDVPRLLEGNVALQVFGVVTHVPRDLSFERNDDRTDDILLLALAQRWPPATWTSVRARALHQARRLERAEAGSGGSLVVVRTRADLERLLERRQGGAQVVGGLLALEGMHALEGKLESVDVLHAAGFRMLAPTHFFDTAVAGSASGLERHGLTPLGEAVLRRMEEKGMTVDLAHASPRTFEDVTRLATRPVVVSHTGVRGTCDNNRNLSDAQLRQVARTGGVVGIAFFDVATCGEDAASVARALRYTADVIGVEHVALGSDFDGAVGVPFDAARLAELTEALLAQGFGEEQLGLVLGGNALRVLRHNLPPGPAAATAPPPPR